MQCYICINKNISKAVMRRSIYISNLERELFGVRFLEEYIEGSLLALR